MDMFAADLSMDPAEVRRKNFIPKDAFPYTDRVGRPLRHRRLRARTGPRVEQAGYAQLRAEQAARRNNGTSSQLGIGLSVYVEVTNGISETEFGSVEITGDGEAIVKTGSLSQGQGHETTFAMIASERLGIPIEKITVLKGDTDVVARGTGTYGSKSTQIGGVAAGQASEEVVEIAKKLAAEELEANPDDMVLDVDAGSFHVAGVAAGGAVAGATSPGGSRAPTGCRSSGPRSTSRPRSRRSRSARTSPSSRSTSRPAASICSG